MHMPSVEPVWTDEVLDFAQGLASQARTIALRWFRHQPDIELKADDSPVTVADRGVEAFLRDEIARRYPNHGLLGEEFGMQAGDAEVLWSIDPIDGTRSFITGNPLWGCLLAVLHQQQPLIGIVDIPYMAERWVAVRGRGCWLNGERCRTSKTTDLAQAVLQSTSPDLFSDADLQAFEHLSKAVHLRRFGGDCYAYALLVSGYVDLVVETRLMPYDYLPLIPLIQEAGGVITDWQGQPLGLGSDGRVVAAANAVLHRQALARLTAQATGC
ncbi:histidinol-phosphatase [Castellaniella sp.]|uniref:histidinol-phosphatase n=1 Tax=Castellaniella sp. TaxID=1955812 RepID=UPI002AFEBEB5|nr:histidinol-phosphatase [Castellaniella sp.]